MKTVSGKRLYYLIRQKGWRLKRINGSHHIFSRVGEFLPASISVHGNKSLKAGLQKKIMKIVGIEENEL